MKDTRIQTKTPYGWWWTSAPDELMSTPLEDRPEVFKKYLIDFNRHGERVVITNKTDSRTVTSDEVYYHHY